MAGSVNKVIIVGNLGKDPELRRTPGGAAVTDFPVATTDRFKAKDGSRQETTEWHNIILWNRQAETACQYLKKGSSVYIEGSLRTRSWDDQNGQKKYRTEIIGQTLQFLDKIGGASTGGASTGGFSGGSSFGEPPFADDDFGAAPTESTSFASAPAYQAPSAPAPIDDDLPF